MSGVDGLRIVSVQTSDERGGGEFANVDLLAALAERGAEPILVTNQPALADGTAVPVREIDLGPKLSKRSWRSLLLRAPALMVRLGRAVRAERPDVTLLHYKKEQLLALVLPRRVTGRVVWAEWGPLPFPLRRGPARLAYLAAARRVSRIMAVSEGTKRTIVEAGVAAEKITVVPNLIDVDHVQPDPSGGAALREDWGAGNGTFVVGVVTRFQHKKRNDVVIDALDHLHGDVLVVFAGDGPDEAPLRERAAAHGDRVRFVGTPRGWVERFLSAVDVQVFAPSPTEGAPRSVIMGQLTGVPVVATAPEGAADLIEPGAGAIVEPPDDPRALAEVLAAYRDDPERRAREGAAARASALERYRPERTLDLAGSVLAGA